MINTLKETLEMDGNAFYPFLLSALLLIPGGIEFLRNTYRNKVNDNNFRVKSHNDFDAFYLQIMIISLIFSLFLIFIYIIVFTFVIKFKISVTLLDLLYFIVLFAAIRFFYTKVFVRKRLLGNHLCRNKILIGAPMMILSSLFLFAIKNFNRMVTICYILYIFAEFFGLINFRSKFIKYDYSYAKILTKNGYSIKDIEVTNLKKKGKWVRIKINGTDVRLRLDEIFLIEYYGESKYVKNI